MGMSPQLIPTIIDQASDHVVFYTGLEKPYGYVDWWPVSMYFNNLEAPYDAILNLTLVAHQFSFIMIRSKV